MEALNNKIFASRDDHYTQAQVVGVTGYNSTQDAMKVAHVTDSNELKVSATITGGGGGTQYDIGDAIPADGTGTIALVKDSLGNATTMEVTPGGALRTSTAGITIGSDATLTQAQQVLVYGRDSSGGVDALKVDNSGKLEVIQDPEQQVGIISNTTQTINSGTALTFSASVDKNGAENMNCLITASSSLQSCSVYFLLSDDNITYYETPMSQFLGDTTAGYVSEIGNPSRYVKIKIENSGVASIDITGVKITWVKGI